MKLSTVIVCLLGLAAATVIPGRAGPSNAELAAVKSYDSRAVDEGFEVSKPQIHTATAAVPSLGPRTEDVSAKKVRPRPRPYGGGNRTPVYIPPTEIMGVTSAQCNQRQQL